MAVPADEQIAAHGVSQPQEDVISALVNLGYAKPSAEKAVQTVVSTSKTEPAFEELLAHRTPAAVEVDVLRSTRRTRVLSALGDDFLCERS